MNQKRINLCFDLDDARQNTAFNLLQASGREKTAVVVNLVLHDALPMLNDGASSKSKEDEKQIFKRFEEIVKENSPQADISEMHKSISQIILQIKNLQLGATLPQICAGEKKADNYSTSTANPEAEMSEDAFSAMMSVFNP